MASVDYNNHARARHAQAVLFRVLNRSEPLLEGATRSHVVRQILDERERNGIRPTVDSLIESSAKRLGQREDGKDKWTYTRRHSVEVGFLSYIIASEAIRNGMPGSEDLDPKLCYIGGILHDIGKTFLPMSLIVKELGVQLMFLKLFQGARMNKIERRVLRDEHISAGTRYVRLFGGNGEIKTILDMVGLHHVMYNGQDSVVPSYPKLFKGKDLPLHSRVAKAADFLSAVLPRHYREHSWIDSFRSAVAYGMAVSGRELDPKVMGCFLTGTHDIEPDEALRIVLSSRHPDGQSGISNYDAMEDHVVNTVMVSEGFARLTESWNASKVIGYEEIVEGFADAYGFPTLGGLSPWSIKNKYQLG
jgi:HD-GYP domain-containing protein (c-di-GMP phosphodiesterase class II)